MELTYASQIRKLGARNAKTRNKRVLGVNLDYGKKVSFLLSGCQALGSKYIVGCSTP